MDIPYSHGGIGYKGIAGAQNQESATIQKSKIINGYSILNTCLAGRQVLLFNIPLFFPEHYQSQQPTDHWFLKENYSLKTKYTASTKKIKATT